MYQQIINELNHFLNTLNIPATPINPNAFQGVFVKKLSNQNIIRDKRRINAGDISSNVNQTHIDITGRQSMLFFFEELNNATTSFEKIDIDLYDNNLRYLHEVDTAIRQTDISGNTYFIRSSTTIPVHLIPWDLTLHSSAYKKYGHAGEQVQINIPEPEEPFTQLQRYAFQDDALVMLRYDYLRYIALLIPCELCDNLYSITNTHGNQNVNIAVLNPSYDSVQAYTLQYEAIAKDVLHDECEAEALQNMLIRNSKSGTDVEKVIKTRISQGAFRRLLLLEHHHCNLCNISTSSVLRASHIKEWSESSREERVDSNNGLLLCANHDALFDRHLISFEPNSGALCISSTIDDMQKKTLNISECNRLTMSDRMKSYMQIHYQKFLSKENL